jgi:H+-translocating NAD(P) transhydrogenase subunit alpha
VVTTALIPGRPAPILVTAAMVEAMRPGSVIADLAADAGGNCELTEPGETVVRHGVTLLGLTNPASRMPLHASQLYARNVSELLKLLVKDGELVLDEEDQVIRDMLLTRGGEVVHGPTRAALEAAKETT